jgi:hypothetical protein
MNATTLAAWVGACSGLGSLIWNIYTKLTSGPKLRVAAFAGMVMMPPPPNNPTFLKITVQNVGTAPTTLTNITLHQYASRWSRFRNRATFSAVLNNYKGPQFPHKLEIGAEWSGLMEQDERFGELLKGDSVWLAAHHSFSKSPTQVKIVQPAPRVQSA